MGMRGSLFAVMAMAAMLGGGMPTGRRESYSSRSKPKPMLSLEERKEKFLSDLKRNNDERKTSFPKFKEWQVYGLTIVAHSQKNAVRDMNKLMHYHNLEIPVEQ